jgi:hypothetical protein
MCGQFLETRLAPDSNEFKLVVANKGNDGKTGAK